MKMFTLVLLDEDGGRTDTVVHKPELLFAEGDTLEFTEDGHLQLTTEEEVEE